MSIGPGIPMLAVCDACGHHERFKYLLIEDQDPRLWLLADTFTHGELCAERAQLVKVRAFLKRNPRALGKILPHFDRVMQWREARVAAGEPAMSDVPVWKIQLPPEPELEQLLPHEDNAMVVNYLHHSYVESEADVDRRLEQLDGLIAKNKHAVGKVVCPTCHSSRYRLVREPEENTSDL